VRLYVSNLGDEDAQQVSVSIQASAPVLLEESCIPLGALRAGVSTPVCTKVDFECDKAVMPSSSEVSFPKRMQLPAAAVYLARSRLQALLVVLMDHAQSV
jgi:hypothetical protein